MFLSAFYVCIIGTFIMLLGHIRSLNHDFDWWIDWLLFPGMGYWSRIRWQRWISAWPCLSASGRWWESQSSNKPMPSKVSHSSLALAVDWLK